MDGGLFSIWGATSFIDSMFADNLGIADFGCGFIFSSHPAAHRVVVNVERCTFLRNRFLPTNPPPEDPNNLLDLTIAAVGCFYQTSSITATVRDSEFYETVASAVGVFAIHPPDVYSQIDAIPETVVFNLDNILFESTNVTDFGSAAVLRVALNLADYHAGPLNHSLSLTNIRFENTKAPATAIVPPSERPYFPITIRTQPSIIQVTNFVGPVFIQNVTFDELFNADQLTSIEDAPQRVRKAVEAPYLFAVSRIHLLNVNSVHLVEVKFGSIPNIGVGGWLWAQHVPHINISNIRPLEFSLLPKSLPKPTNGKLDASISELEDIVLDGEVDLDELSSLFSEPNGIKHTSKASAITASDSIIQWELFRFEGDGRSTTSTISFSDVLFSNWTFPIPTKLLKVVNYRKLNIKSLRVHNTTIPFPLPLIEVEVDALTMRDCHFRQFASLLSADVSSALLEDITIEEYKGAVFPMEISTSVSATFNRFTVRQSSFSIIRLSGIIEAATIRNSTFDDVRSAAIGGVISIERTSPIWRANPEVLIDASIFNSSTGSAGGALACLTACTVTVNHSTFFNNSASSASGGALFVAEGFIYVHQSTFTSNYAELDGGAIFTSGFPSISNSTFESNTAQRVGGAIGYADSSRSPLVNPTIMITNSTFLLNSAEKGGGAIFAFGATQRIYISKCRFRVNSVALYLPTTELFIGGAILASSEITVLGSNFHRNQAPRGGSIALLSAEALKDSLSLEFDIIGAVDRHLVRPLTLMNVDFEDGRAVRGGALYALQQSFNDTKWCPSLSMVKITRCELGGLHGVGGAIAIENIEPDLSASSGLIASCTAHSGAGIFISRATTPIKPPQRLIFQSNKATFSGAEIQYGYIDNAANASSIVNNTNNIGNTALWGASCASSKIKLSALLIWTTIPFGNESYSFPGKDPHQYFVYPGAERTAQIFAYDQFDQAVSALNQAFDFSLSFNCTSTKELCDLLDFNWHMTSVLTAAQFSFQIAKPGVSALLPHPISGHITIVASSKLGIAPYATTSLSITILGCGAGYGEVVRDRSLQSLSDSLGAEMAGYSPISASLGISGVDFAPSLSSSPIPTSPAYASLLDDQPPLSSEWYTCSVCPRFRYSFNGTCASCALDSAVDSCEADKVVSPPTWWVMTDAKTNSYKSFRCAESYCGAGNVCLLSRQGTMCGECQAGTHESITSMCVKCSRPNWPLIVLAFCGLWVAVLVLHSMLAVSSGKATILIFFVQTAWSIRLQIPVVSSFSLTLLVRAANWVLCLWPMDFIDRKILFASVPFIMMAQLCLTFAGYYIYCIVRRTLCPSKAINDGYQSLSSTELSSGSLEDIVADQGAGYGALSDEDSLVSDADSFLYDSDSILNQSEMLSNPEELNWSSLSEAENGEQGRSLSNTLSIDSATFESLKALESHEHIESILADETRVWVVQNAYFHHYRLIRTLLGLFANSFSAVLGIIMSTLGCIDLLDGSRVLAASPSISCTSSKFILMRKLYAFFIPWLLIVAGFIFGKLTHSYFKDKLSRTDVRFGVWYEMYKPKLFAWKIVEFIRRALIATIGDLLISERSLRALLLSVVMLLSLAVHLIASPYRHQLENNLESISLFFLTSIGLLVLWQSRQIVETSAPSQMSLVIMILISVVLCAAFGYRSAKAKIASLWKKSGWKLPFSAK